MCDRALVAQLVVAARKLGHETVVAPLLTSATLMPRLERERWAQHGYAAVDMESGLIVAPRIGVIRVILDTPARELSGEMAAPRERLPRSAPLAAAIWLARNAPRCARIAAEITAAVLR